MGKPSLGCCCGCGCDGNGDEEDEDEDEDEEGEGGGEQGRRRGGEEGFKHSEGTTSRACLFSSPLKSFTL